MKKIFFVLLICVVSLSSFADHWPPKKEKSSFLKKESGEKCFNENTHIINLGVGFGGRSYYSRYSGVNVTRYGTTPAISLTYEQALPKKLGPGYLGIGAYFGFQRSYYEYDNGYYDPFLNYNTYYYRHNWNYYMIAARAAYHWDVLNAKNAEVYAGAIVGVRFQTHNYKTNDPGGKDPYPLSQSSVYPAYSAFAGARWYFVPSVGLFAEVGYGISYATVGFSFKF